MNEQRDKDFVRYSIDSGLSSIKSDPWLAQRIIANEEGKPVAKKISASVIFVIALIILSMTAAIAAGLGLFDELAQNPRGDSRLADVNNVADSIEGEWTTKDGITFRIEQAYFEGNRVFISYRLIGDWCKTVLHEGIPKDDIAWDQEFANYIVPVAIFAELAEE